MARRFQFNVPGRRGETDPWFTVGSLEVTTTIIVSFLAALGYFIYAASARALFKLPVIPSEVRGGQLWRLVTWPMLNYPRPGTGPLDAIFSIFNIFIFWWMGKNIEAEMGRRRFVIFIVTATVIPAIVATAINTGLGGIEYLALAPFAAFVAEHAQARMIFNLPMWVIGALNLAIVTLKLIGERNLRLLLVVFVIVVLALLMSRAYGLASDTPWVPKLRIPGSGAPGKKKAKRGKGKLVAVPSGSSGAPKLDLSAQVEMDGLLDKISAGGMESLSSAERKRLEQLSKQLRGK
jgi:hypothetical protein